LKKEDKFSLTKERIKAIPRSPGVYLMKNRKGEVIYIGKAKDLRSRVRSYFGKGDGRYNISYIQENLSNIETLVCENERQALVLESDLIKKYRPRYNIRLKDDRAHLLVRIDESHPWPRLELTRKEAADGARYLGPFAFTYELRALLEIIKRTVPLRTCSDSMLNNRMRPCLEYQIKRCCAPCCLEVDPAEYSGWLLQAQKILKGDTAEVVLELETGMEKAVEQLRFEDAAVYRDRIEILKKVGSDSREVRFGEGAIDCFGFYREGDNIELSILMVRRGRLFGSKTYGFEGIESPSEDVLSSALVQFYSKSETIPEQIIIPFELEDIKAHEQLYQERLQQKVNLLHPKRGAKARLLVLAKENAKQNFEARFSDVNKSDRLLKALQSHLKLEGMPRVIECVDISHFQGGATVGSIVCFKDAKPDKTRYRTFHLDDGKVDDFDSIAKVLRRHLSRAVEENTLSDLLIIDGGRGQLSSALKVKTELGLLNPAMVAMAKKKTLSQAYLADTARMANKKAKTPERVFLQEAEKPVVLAQSNEALHLLERIRNEAHRVAISFHRKTRTGKTVRSSLDDIPGVGPARKKKLLQEFKSVAGVKNASVEEIIERAGVPRKTAELIKKRFAKS
jgi:excinuclease ABC subunit C